MKTQNEVYCNYCDYELDVDTHDYDKARILRSADEIIQKVRCDDCKNINAVLIIYSEEDTHYDCEVLVVEIN